MAFGRGTEHDELRQLVRRFLADKAASGVTREHDLHLYLRRSKVDELLYDGPADHYDRLVTLKT